MMFHCVFGVAMSSAERVGTIIGYFLVLSTLVGILRIFMRDFFRRHGEFIWGGTFVVAIIMGFCCDLTKTNSVRENATESAAVSESAGDDPAEKAEGHGIDSATGAATTEMQGPPPTLEEALAELDSLVGMEGVKAEVRKLVSYTKIMRQRQAQGLKGANLSYHMVFTGNPGTGKTTVARIVGKIYRALGLLEKGHLVEVDRSAFASQYKGGAERKTKEIVDRALGGVLFIDEAYSLTPSKGGGDGGDAAAVIAQLMKRMEDDRDRLVVIVAGYTDEMKVFMDANPGMKSRFNRTIEFPDYTAGELAEIFRRMAKKNQYRIESTADEGLERAMAAFTRHRDRQFGNGRFVRNLFEKSVERQAVRLSAREDVGPEDLQLLQAVDIDLKPPEEVGRPKFEDMMSELDGLVGMEEVKAEVRKLANWVKAAKEREAKGLDVPQMTYHFVFTGNPGTGKTTVARIIARVFQSLGLLRKGHLVETDRSGLVGEYIGQTAVKTNKKIDEALDGVLFIDEAYSLAGSGKDYGAEAVATLLKRMEDDRDRLVVVIAGYTDEMEKFMDLNSGLKSRFTRTVHFPDYSAKELAEMFRRMAKKNKFTLSPDVEKWLNGAIGLWTKKRDRHFGNGRWVRTLFERTLERQASRIAGLSNPTTEQLTTLTMRDVGIKLKDPDASLED